MLFRTRTKSGTCRQARTKCSSKGRPKHKSFDQPFVEQLEQRILLHSATGIDDWLDNSFDQDENGSVTAQIHGIKWVDSNGNTQRDANEPGLPGVTIYLDTNNNARLDSGEPHTVTMDDDPESSFNETGRYWLTDVEPGNHLVREVVPDEFRQTFPRIDARVDASRPFEIISTGVALDFNLTGVTVSTNANGQPEFELETTVVWPNSCGSIVDTNYTVDGNHIWIDVFGEQKGEICAMVISPVSQSMNVGQLEPGNYSVLATLHEEIHTPNHVEDDTFVPTLAVEGTLSVIAEAHVVELDRGDVLEKVHFGNQHIRSGSVHGVKWEDLDGDGQRGPDERGLPGITIFTDRNHNGRLDNNEPHTVTMEDDPTTSKDESGMYQLQGLRPGLHFIFEVLSDGYVQTFPVGPVPLPTEPVRPDDEPIILPLPFPTTPHVVDIELGGEVKGIDFGNQLIVPGSVHGIKWEDLDGDGQRGRNERGLPGITIFSDRNHNGRLDNNEPHTVTMEDDSTTSEDESGTYQLRGLRPGLHFIFEVLPDDHIQTFPVGPIPIEPVRPGQESIIFPPPSPTTPHVVNIESGGEVKGIDFGNRRIERGSVQGVKWEDLDGDGKRGRNERGLPGITIFTDRNHNGRLDANEPHTVTMEDDPTTSEDESGMYQLRGLRPGLHFVFEVLPDGHVQTFPVGPVPTESLRPDDEPTIFPPSSPTTPHLVFLESGGEVKAIDFGNRSIELGSVHGVKWEDLDGDGQRGRNERGLSGITIFTDQNRNGRLDNNEPHTVTMEDDPTTSEDESGMYRLRGLRPGLHFIFEVLPDGHIQTFPVGPILTEPVRPDDEPIILPPLFPTIPHMVFLEPGEDVKDIDFGNRSIELASVHGVKWEDLDGDKQRGRNERGIPGITIFTDRNHNGRLDNNEPHTVTMEDDPTTSEDESGMYRLRGLRPGLHFIFEVLPDGHVQTFPVGPIPTEPVWPSDKPILFPPPSPTTPHPVFLKSGEEVKNIDFGNRPIGEPNGSIHGIKWLDRNGNGKFDRNEPKLSGVTVYVDANRNGLLDPDEPHTATMYNDPLTPKDETGHYRLERLPAGIHLIREVVPDGFRQTFPHPNPELDANSDGFDSKEDNFANVHPESIVVTLPAGEERDTVVSLTIHPFLLVPIEVDVTPSKTHVPFVNSSGVQTNGGGGDTSSFNISLSGNGRTLHYDLKFVDTSSGAVYGEIPVTVFSSGMDSAHRVVLEPGDIVEGIHFGNQPIQVEPGSIHGLKWADLDGNGKRGHDEPGLPGVTIFSDRNGNRKLDNHERHTVTMEDDPSTPKDESGTYWLKNLRPGTHFIFEVVPDDHIQTFPFSVVTQTTVFPPPPVPHTVFLKSGGIVKEIDFGNRPIDPPDGSIHGIKWLDSNGNGELDRNELGIPGITVYADLNRNGALDPDEPHTVTTEENPFTDFDEGGRYQLTGLPAGTYVVREVVPDGSRQTFPLNSAGNAGAHLIHLEPGDMVEKINFGNRLIIEPTGSIHGMKWLDANGNGERENNELGLAGVIIYSDLNNNSTLDSNEPHTVSMTDNRVTDFDETGLFKLQGLQFGDHIIREIVPTDFVQTFPGPALDGAHFVVVTPTGPQPRLEFGNQPIRHGSVHGIKWFDHNHNGIRDNNERGIPGVVIYSDLNNNGGLNSHEPHTVTMNDNPLTRFDETGLYWLTDLDLGHHILRELVPAGFVQTFPQTTGNIGGGAHEVFLHNGFPAENLDFGNRPIRNLPPQVIGIFVRGTGWTGEHLRHLEEIGLGNAQLGYAVHGDPTPGYSNLNQISIMLNEYMELDAGDLSVLGLSNSYEVTDFSYNPDTWSATWTLASMLQSDNFVIQLNEIIEAEPSENGFDLDFHITQGDTDGDCDIDTDDLFTLVTHYDPNGNNGVHSHRSGNLDGDNDIDFIDYNTVADLYNPTGQCGIQPHGDKSPAQETSSPAIDFAALTTDTAASQYQSDGSGFDEVREVTDSVETNSGLDMPAQQAAIDEYFTHSSQHPAQDSISRDLAGGLSKTLATDIEADSGKKIQNQVLELVFSG